MLLISAGIFGREDKLLEVAFLQAVDSVNNWKNVLPRTKLVADVIHIDEDGSFKASNLGEFYNSFASQHLVFDEKKGTISS